MTKRDLLERVNQILDCMYPDKAHVRPLLIEMRDEIERLRAGVEKLKESGFCDGTCGKTGNECWRDRMLANEAHHTPVQEPTDG